MEGGYVAMMVSGSQPLSEIDNMPITRIIKLGAKVAEYHGKMKGLLG
jgi:hypothetical protein